MRLKPRAFAYDEGFKDCTEWPTHVPVLDDETVIRIGNFSDSDNAWALTVAVQYGFATRARGVNHRAKSQYGQTGRITVPALVAIFERQDGNCALCADELNPRDYHVDHIQPLAKGGDNKKANIQLTCSACNLKKGSRL